MKAIYAKIKFKGIRASRFKCLISQTVSVSLFVYLSYSDKLNMLVNIDFHEVDVKS